MLAFIRVAKIIRTGEVFTMNKQQYQKLEDYMLECMSDSAHDKEHVYRVLYNALEIAKTEQNIDYDILIASCLLHDIGRKEQFDNPELCHAMVGGDKAYKFLLQSGFGEEYGEQVRQCIWSHRYRKNASPQSLEAKILFDADKIDVTGAIGIARTLFYKGQVSEPLYSIDSEGNVSSGEDDPEPSFFQEYKYKLESIYSRFYTAQGEKMAKQRQEAAISFYNNLLHEVKSSYQNGKIELKDNICE